MLVAKGIYYKRQKQEVLSNVSLEIQEAKIIGLLGPNGSGKSTLMQTLAGYVSFEKGELSIDGKTDRDYILNNTVYMNHKLNFPGSWHAKKLLKLYEGATKDFNRQRFMGMAKSLEIDLDKPLKKMSRGEKERLSLSLSLSQEVKYYFLDEPLTGIDIITREEILRSLLVFASPEATIVISSHYIDIFEMLFEEVYFIKEGSITACIDPEEVRASGLTLSDKYKQQYSKGGQN